MASVTTTTESPSTFEIEKLQNKYFAEEVDKDFRRKLMNRT